MKLEEAISGLDIYFEKHRSHLTFTEREFIALCIEAGKRVGDCRQVICDFSPLLLPGETK